MRTIAFVAALAALSGCGLLTTREEAKFKANTDCANEVGRLAPEAAAVAHKACMKRKGYVVE